MTISKNPKLRKKLDEFQYQQEKLCEANKLLVSRMISNPEEFHLSNGGKWADYLSMLHQRVSGDINVLVMLDDAECEFMWGKYVETAKKNLHQNFMKRLLRDESDAD